MTKYCRYCQHFVTGNGNWCEEKKWSPSDKYVRNPNWCDTFELNPIDAFGENLNGYHSRPPKKDDGEQMKMEVGAW